MTTYLFGNSNRRHIANPHNPDTTLCGIDGYWSLDEAVAKADQIARPAQKQWFMALPLCPTCHRTHKALQ